MYIYEIQKAQKGVCIYIFYIYIKSKSPYCSSFPPNPHFHCPETITLSFLYVLPEMVYAQQLYHIRLFDHILLKGFVSIIEIWGGIILCCGDCPVCYRVFSSVPGLYPLDASSPSSPTVTTKNVSRHDLMDSEGQNCPS